MNNEDFRDFGKETIEYIINYRKHVRDRDVIPNVEPGYLFDRLPKEAPEKADSWRQVLEDVEKHIMPGMTHWQSPHFHGYFPAGTSYPSIVGEMLIAGINCIGFSWIASPVCTELEMVVMDWLAKMMDLPEEFLNSHPGDGGSSLQGSASDATLVCLLTSRELTVNRVSKEKPDLDKGIIRSKLVAYTSDQSNSSVQKSGLLGAVPMKHLPTDENCSLRGATLLEYIKKDIEAGFIPFYIVATFGTTPTCAFDNLEEIGPICKKYNIWLHVDAAYAGAALICPEFRHLMRGINYVDSFTFSPHKWMLVNYDCSALWVRKARDLTETFNVERVYLEHNTSESLFDYRHWQTSLGRRFRALKVWFVLRLYGIEGLQNYIRRHIKLAKVFERLVRKDNRFEIPTKASLGLVCFRLKGNDDLTKKLLEKLTSNRKIYVIPASYRDQILIRFAIGNMCTEEEDIHFAWNEITSQASEVLQTDLKSRNITEDFYHPQKEIESLKAQIVTIVKAMKDI